MTLASDDAAAIARHDMRNCLQAVRSCLSMIERRIAGQRLTEANDLVIAARHQLDLAIDLSGHVQPGRYAGKVQTVDASALVQGMRPAIGAILHDGIRLRIATARQPCLVSCDRALLERAVMNLVVNARDAMPVAGRLTVQVRPAATQVADVREADWAAGPVAEITVSDTGDGMDPVLMARACAPYFTTKAPGKGTGLGLFQLRSFAEDAGGFIQLSSQPGIGTTVRLRLPLAAGPTG